MALTVLVVDDNRLMRGMVSRSVAMSGLSVDRILEAGDGAQALELMRREWIDLVLLDINMPVMDGEAFLAALRAEPALSTTMVVVVSTESSQPRIARLTAMGAGFVRKPFQPEHLVEAVDGLLARPRTGAP